MSVGASDHRDQEADFSNRNSYLDIVASGKDIYSLKSGGGYDRKRHFGGDPLRFRCGRTDLVCQSSVEQCTGLVATLSLGG